MTCIHFGTCGGCKHQNISYEEELAQKQAFVETLFLNHSISPIIACASPWEYRNKMEFSFSQSRAGLRFGGLMAKRGKVVNLEECKLCPPWFISALDATRKWWEKSNLDAYFPPKDIGHLRNLTLRTGFRTGEKMAFLTVSGHLFEEVHLETFVQALLSCEKFDSILLRRQIAVRGKPTVFEERLLYGKNHIHERLHNAKGEPFHFKIRASSFFQPNTFQAEKLIQKALSLAEIEGINLLYDLFAGTATFGIMASKLVKNVLAIEINPDSVEDAKENLRLNNITNLDLILGDVGALCPQGEKVECVILDPPRAGLSQEALSHLKRLNPQKILYVSCNPVTQARDVLELLAYGYKIKAIQPVDQFPRTPHVENIVVMDRSF